MLTIQYRMHKTIMNWSSNELYNGRIMADASVRAHLLCELPNVKRTDDTSCPMVLIDTASCQLEVCSVVVFVINIYYYDY